MSFEVHREPLYRRYYATSFSGACCYSIAFGFILIVLPLIIAYNTSAFWLKDDVIYEQPSVSYRYYTIVELHGLRNGAPMNLYYSTSPTTNKLNTEILRIPLFQSAELDDNRDGFTDRLELGIQMPLTPAECIYSLNSVVYFDVKFETIAKYEFDAVSYINFESTSCIAKVDIDGDLLLRQTWPLSAKGGYKVPYSSDPLINIQANTAAKDIYISTIMHRNNARNYSMTYRKNFEYVERRVGSVPTDNSTVPYFNASMIIRIPIQPMRYTPTVSAVLKNAWIQYISFFAVISFLLFRLNSFVFRHKLLHTHITADIIYEKMD